MLCTVLTACSPARTNPNRQLPDGAISVGCRRLQFSLTMVLPIHGGTNQTNHAIPHHDGSGGFCTVRKQFKANCGTEGAVQGSSKGTFRGECPGSSKYIRLPPFSKRVAVTFSGGWQCSFRPTWSRGSDQLPFVPSNRASSAVRWCAPVFW